MTETFTEENNMSNEPIKETPVGNTKPTPAEVEHKSSMGQQGQQDPLIAKPPVEVTAPTVKDQKV